MDEQIPCDFVAGRTIYAIIYVSIRCTYFSSSIEWKENYVRKETEILEPIPSLNPGRLH